MAATVKILSYHGSTPSGPDVKNQTIRFKTADDDGQNAQSPLVIPDSGYQYSYVKQLRLSAETAPTTVIENIRVFTDGALSWTDCGCYIVTGGMTYLDPTSQQDTALTGWTDNFGTFTSANPLLISGHLAAPNTGAFGDYVRLQLRVGSSATPGVQSAETITFRYDEY